MAYTFDVKENGKVLSGFIVILGLWMVASPWILGFDAIIPAVWNSVIVGLVVTIIAVARILLPNEFANLSWINAGLGLWFLLAPFVFSYGDGQENIVENINPAVGNHVVCGIFLTVLAWLSAAFNNPRLGE